MKEKYKKSLYIPNELLLEIFADKNLDIQNIIVVSMVCKLWYELSLDNAVWRPLFIKRFSYSPTLANHSIFKEDYQKQLALTQAMKKKCESNHACRNEPGLLEAIREKNIPLIYALFESGHRIIIDSFPDGEQQFTEEMLGFLSECAELPSSLLARIFKRGFCTADMETSEFLALHFIVAEADEKLLQKIFRALGDDLLSVSRYCDLYDNNFFSSLLHFPVERFSLVLRLLYETLGKTKLSTLLVYQNHTYTDWSCIHSASRCGREYFFITLKYLKRQDYPVLLKKGLNDEDIPLFNIAYWGDKESLSHIINILGADATTFLKYKENKGRNILLPALLSEDHSTVELIEKVMGMEFIDLLLMQDTNGRDILRRVMLLQEPTVLRRINTVLKLLRDYDCLDIAQELYSSDEFTQLISQNLYINQDETIELFNKYTEEKTNNFCSIL